MSVRHWATGTMKEFNVAVIAETLFCPDCGNEDLWSDDSVLCVTSCWCGGQWESNELHRICTELVSRARTIRMSQHYAQCFRILLRHMFNPFTGECYGTEL